MRNRRAGFLSVVLIVASQIGCGEPSAEELAAKIAASEELRHIDRICMELPKPPTFKQIKKGISGNSGNTIVYYQFASDMSFVEMRDFYQDSSVRGQYILTGEHYQEPERFISLLSLQREDVRIVLENRPPSAIFNLDCIK